MDINEINLNKVKNDEILNIYAKTKEFIGYLEDELEANEVEKS